MKLTYSTTTNRFRDTQTGRFIGRVEARKVLDNVIDKSKVKMQSFTYDLLSAESSIEQWQDSMIDEINNIHLSFIAVANGGFSQIKNDVVNRAEYYLNSQYYYLQQFANQIYTGEQRPDGTALYRSTLYAESARITYESERRIIEKESGATEELNVLGSSDSCDGCLEATSQGWVPIDTLAAIGDRDCGPKCRCTIVFRKGESDTLGSELEEF